MENLLNVNGIIDKTYDLYRKYLGSFIGYTSLMYITSVAITYGVLLVISIILSVIATISIPNYSYITDGPNVSLILYLLIGICILIIPAAAIIKMIDTGPIQAVYADIRGQKVTFGNMFRYSFKKFWYSFTSTIAFYIIIFGVLIIGGLLYYLIYTSLIYKTNLTVQIIIGVVIGLIMLAIIIWFYVKSIFYLQVAVCERKHFFAAIAGSFKLTENHFKRILGIAFSLILSYIIIFSSLGGMLSFINNLLTVFFTNKSSTGVVIGIMILKFILVIVQLAATVIVMPINYISVPIAYSNERNRLYGDDLHRRVNILIKKQKKVQ